MVQNVQLSKNFWLYDYLKSETAERNSEIKNEQFSPSEDVISNLIRVNGLLQRVRDWYGLPIRVSSGYRSPALNAAVGGAKTSQHLTGMAVDFEPLDINGREANGCDYKKIATWIFDNITFDQMIKEYGTSECPSWLHLSSVVDKNRKQGLEIGEHTGKKYIPLNFNNWIVKEPTVSGNPSVYIKILDESHTR